MNASLTTMPPFPVPFLNASFPPDPPSGPPPNGPPPSGPPPSDPPTIAPLRSPPPPSPLDPLTDVGSIIGIRNAVSDTSILTGLWISSIVCVCVMIAFCWLQHASMLYRYRLVAKNVNKRPPKLATSGWISYFDWAVKAITVADVDFVQSAGLDALIMVKMCALGVQMFLPMCIFGVLVLIPVHWVGGESETTDASQSTFMRLTMSNITPGSGIFWLHFCFVYIYIAWSMYLLHWHYHQYLTIRQHYLRKGDDINVWRNLYQSQPTPAGDIRKFLQAVPLIRALLPTAVPTDDDVSERGVEPVKDSDDEDQAAVDHTESAQPAVLRNTSSARFASEVRQRRLLLHHTGSSRLNRLQSTRDASRIRSAMEPGQTEFPRSRQLKKHGSMPPARSVATMAPRSHGGARPQPGSGAAGGQEDSAFRPHVAIAGVEGLRQGRDEAHMEPRLSAKLVTHDSVDGGTVADSALAQPSPAPASSAAAGVNGTQHAAGPVAEAAEDSLGGDPAAAAAVPVESSTRAHYGTDVQGKASSTASSRRADAAASGPISEAPSEITVIVESPDGRRDPSKAQLPRDQVDQLDDDANLVMWWREFGRLRNGGRREDPRAETGSIPPPGGQSICLVRPSVSQQKTVNAISYDGKDVAVMAQHYAVLVMDVVAPKDTSSTQGDEGQALPGATTVLVNTSFRRVMDMLPRSLRRWFNLGYGQQAARKLNPQTVSSPSDDVTDPKPLRLSSTARSTASRSTALYGALQLARKGSLGLPMAAPLRPHLEHPARRRRFSTGDTAAVAAAAQAIAQGTALHGLSPQLGVGHAELPPAGSLPVKLGTPVHLGTQRSQRPAVHFTDLLGALVEQATAARGVLRNPVAGPTAGTSQKSLGSPAAASTGPPGTQAQLPTQTHRQQQQQQRKPGHNRARSLGDTLVSGAAASNGAVAAPLLGGRFSVDGRSPASASIPQSDAEALAAAPAGLVRHGAGPVAEADEGADGTMTGAGSGTVTAGGQVSAADGGVAPGESGDKEGAALASGSGILGVGEGVDMAAADTDGDVKGGGSSGDPAAPQSDDAVASLAAPASKWDLVREAVWDGRVALLPTRKRYCLVSATFSKLFPGEFDRAIPVIKHKKVDLLLMQADLHLAQYEYAKRYEEVTGKELRGRIGGICGEKKRLREYHLEQVNKLMEQVRVARRRAFEVGQTPSWFVFFRTQRAAAIASQCVIHAEDNRQFRVFPAPGPEEVNWSALWSNYAARDMRRLLVRPLVLLMVLFPIGIFSGALMQLEYLLCAKRPCATSAEGSEAWFDAGCTPEIAEQQSRQLYWSFYCAQQNIVAKALKHVLVGWVPSLLVTLYQGMVLPLVFTYVVQTSRSYRSLSDADRAIAKNMFYFAVFNVFLGGVVGSTIVQGVNAAIAKGPSEIFNLIGTYVPTSSNFFINYTMFRALVALPLRMLWPHIGVRMYLVRRFFRFSCIITKRDKAFLLAPVSPRYGFEVGMVMLTFVIAAAFSVVSPLLLLMAVLFFMMSWLFWRWALLYVYVRKYEGGGTMWPFVFKCILACLGIFPLFTACVFVTKHAYIQAIILLATVPVILVRFNNYIYTRFQSGITAMPLEVTLRAPLAQVEPWVYTPPPLLNNLAGWNPDWCKCWQGWNMPVMYG